MHAARIEGKKLTVTPFCRYTGAILMMPILQYETQVLEDGSITLPLLPEYRNRKVVVYVNERQHNVEDGDEPTPTDKQLERMYTMCRGALEGMTREEFDQLREERIMGGKR
jgi:hypothetical protein